MGSLGEDLGGAIKGGICAALQANNALADFASGLVGDVNGNLSILSRLIYSKYCTQPPPPPEVPPYEGGQCEFCYTVFVTRTVDDPGGPTTNGQATTNQALWGPIVYLGLTGTPEGSVFTRWKARFSCHGLCLSPRQDNSVVVELTNDLLLNTGEYTVDDIQVVPPAGQGDDCGNPPPQPPPSVPDQRVFPIDFDYTYNDGTDFNITGNVFFGLAYFDTDFNVNVPLKFVLNNNLQFTGNINLDAGDININFGDDVDYPSPPPPEGDYRPDPGDPPPPPSEEPPPPGFEPPFPPPDEIDPDDPKDFDDDQPKQSQTIRRIIGVLVDTVLPPSMPSQINQDDNPVVYAPDIGLVNFGYIVAGNRFYWGEDIRVKNRRQVIFTPEGRYAAEVRGTIRQGGQWVLTPLYARVPVESVGG